MVMTIQDYLDHAQEAERLARLAQSESERAAYERIAAVWRQLAEGDEAEIPASRTGSIARAARPPQARPFAVRTAPRGAAAA